ncbi:MAG TPA: MEDS domain-containing protein [Thermoplasmata archaeon]|nr:MEDS domain-containing protein [Thermoplasmata archaeon]
MVEIIESAQEVPTGGHVLSLHSSRKESGENAVAFLAGAPSPRSARYFVSDAETAKEYRESLAVRAPDHVGCVAILPEGQVAAQEGQIRPSSAVRAFLAEHPDGVTAAGETITRHWSIETVPEHLEYERWFDEQPRDQSRFLCPYDLREIPPKIAPEVLRTLGDHHSHVVLSRSREPAVRLLQLFVFPTVGEIPEALQSSLAWAEAERLVERRGAPPVLALTALGEQLVRAWSVTAVVDW